MEDEQARPIIFELLKQIPEGKVASYKAIAEAAGAHSRQVGRILHTNTNPEMYPCHRVVHSDGTTAGGYVFGGPGIQQQRLEDEGVEFKGKRVANSSFFFTNFPEN